MQEIKLNGNYYRVYKNPGESQKTVRIMIPYDFVRNFEIFAEDTLDISEDTDILAVHLTDGETILIECDYDIFYKDITEYNQAIFAINNKCTCK